MFTKFCAFVLFVFCALASRAEAQECVPSSVTNMHLSTHHILHWEIREEEECEITQFLVYIYERDHPVEYSFEIDYPWVDVSFLEVCREWTFVVVPVSHHTRGKEHRLFASVPIPHNADLSIAYINVTRNGVTGDYHLSWDLTDFRLGTCTIRYRLTIEEVNEVEIHDIYLSERSINMHFLSPCTTYQFGVRAINIASPTVEGPLKTAYILVPSARQIAPHLDTVLTTMTEIYMKWSYQPASRNSCKVEKLIIDGGNYFHSTIDLDDEKREPVEVRFRNLRPNSMYYVRTVVLNSVGTSEPTVVAIQTMEFTSNEDNVHTQRKA